MSESKVTQAGLQKRLSLKSMVVIAFMATVLAVLGPLAVPIGPVPISMSLVAVFLTAYIAGPVKGSFAVGIYILLGLVGVPVFAKYGAGAGVLFGPTGGFIFSYFFVCLIAGFFIERFSGDRVDIQVAGMVLGLIVCYAMGTIWFSAVTKKTIEESLALCVYPFIALDIVKIMVCFLIGNQVRRTLKTTGLI